MKTIKSIDEVKTWDDFAEYAKASDPRIKEDMEEAEQLALVASAAIASRPHALLSEQIFTENCTSDDSKTQFSK